MHLSSNAPFPSSRQARPIISDADRVLLQACLRSGTEVRAAFERWKPFATPERLEGRILRLMPLLFRNLERNGISDPILPWLKGLAKHVWLTGTLRTQASLVQVRRLQDAGVRVLLLKGAALQARCPEIVDTRPMGDFDILVPPLQLRRSLQVLQSKHPDFIPASIVGDADIALHHAVPVPLGHPQLWIDLHWRPAAAIRDPAHGQGVFDRSEPAKLLDVDVGIAGLPDHLFILLAHALYNLASRRIDWVAEAALILDRFGRDIDWTEFDRLTSRYGFTAWSDTALESIAEITGSPRSGWRPHEGAATSKLQALEVAARQAQAPSAVEALTCAVSDAGRGQRPHADRLRDRGAIAHSSRASLLSGLLRPASCFRLLSSWERGDLDLASLESGTFAAAQDNSRDSFLYGWSIPQAAGRWSDGARAWALFSIREDSAVDVHLRVSGIPHVPPRATPLGADVWAGATTARWNFDVDPDGITRQTIAGRVRHWRGRPVIPLFIHYRTPMDAASRGRIDTDDRQLGIFLQHLDCATPFTVAETAGLRSFTTPDDCRHTFWKGWDKPSPGGRWTIGSEAILLLRLPAAARRLRMVPSMVLARHGSSGQTVRISVNGRQVLATEVQTREPTRPLDFPLPRRSGTRLTEVRLRIGTPVSPSEIGLSQDRRQLGVMIQSVEIVG